MTILLHAEEAQHKCCTLIDMWSWFPNKLLTCCIPLFNSDFWASEASSLLGSLRLRGSFDHAEAAYTFVEIDHWRSSSSDSHIMSLGDHKSMQCFIWLVWCLQHHTTSPTPSKPVSILVIVCFRLFSYNFLVLGTFINVSACDCVRPASSLCWFLGLAIRSCIFDKAVACCPSCSCDGCKSRGSDGNWQVEAVYGLIIHGHIKHTLIKLKFLPLYLQYSLTKSRRTKLKLNQT